MASELTDEEMSKVKRAFEDCDADRDGKLTIDDFGMALRWLEEDPSDDDLLEAFESIGLDGTGTIDFEEYLHLLTDGDEDRAPLYDPPRGCRTFPRRLCRAMHSCVYHITRPLGRCIAILCGICVCAICRKRYARSAQLPEESELGTREEALRSLGACARLVGGTGFIDRDLYYKYDPPLNGRSNGWKIKAPLDQVCETTGSDWAIQAACYTNKDYPQAAIVAFRGTSTTRGVYQDATILFPHKGTPIHEACKQALNFTRICQDKHEGKTFFVTGHSLGGYLAEKVASHMDLQGASFNSPGPWAAFLCCTKDNTGSKRPNFEVHLTKDDQLARALFPWPQHSRHIAKPTWHDGNVHRVCIPYVPSEVPGVPTRWANYDDVIQTVDQWEELGLDEEIEGICDSDDEGDIHDNESEQPAARYVLTRKFTSFWKK